jgi:hypothetical protein
MYSFVPEKESHDDADCRIVIVPRCLNWTIASVQVHVGHTAVLYDGIGSSMVSRGWNFDGLTHVEHRSLFREQHYADIGS